jgi:hypothetical protein
MNGCACFDFNTDQCPVLILYDDVDLILILISVVMERIGFIGPCGLLHDFGKCECFEHSTKCWAVLYYLLSSQRQQRGEQPRVDKM